jgi:hypothetical protein
MTQPARVDDAPLTRIQPDGCARGERQVVAADVESIHGKRVPGHRRSGAWTSGDRAGGTTLTSANSANPFWLDTGPDLPGRRRVLGQVPVGGAGAEPAGPEAEQRVRLRLELGGTHSD